MLDTLSKFHDRVRNSLGKDFGQYIDSSLSSVDRGVLGRWFCDVIMKHVCVFVGRIILFEVFALAMVRFCGLLYGHYSLMLPSSSSVGMSSHVPRNSPHVPTHTLQAWVGELTDELKKPAGLRIHDDSPYEPTIWRGTIRADPGP